jgi:hypothetical protein
MTALLGHTRFSKDATPTSGDGVTKKLRLVRFSVATDSAAQWDGASSGEVTAVYVAWLGTKTSATLANVHLDLSNEPRALDLVTNKNLTSSGGMSALLVTLSRNSTNGIQSVLPVVNNGLTLTVSEMPIFILVGGAGLQPQPPSGPVPPVDPQPSVACEGLARGLSCTAVNGSSAPTTNYIICPGGQQETCLDGEFCFQTAPGHIECKVDPASPCANKTEGLYCNPNATKPSPSWPDPYVECPALIPLYCPIETPTCVQNGTTVDCV